MNTSTPSRAAASAPQDLTSLIWRQARASDAEHLIRIYNESVAGGGHSPTLANGTPQEMQAIITLGRRKGWPVWVMAAPDDTPIAWAHMRAIVWAPEACRSVGDLWLYVAEAWHGSGIAMRMIRGVFRECRRYGFDTVTCWILGTNRRSLSLVRACRLERWALMPAVVDYGGLRFDLEVWGCRLDDPAWLAHMTRLDRRHARLERARGARRASADGATSAPIPAAPVAQPAIA